jgi:hypothetical protein
VLAPQELAEGTLPENWLTKPIRIDRIHDLLVGGATHSLFSKKVERSREHLAHRRFAFGLVQWREYIASKERGAEVKSKKLGLVQGKRH